MIVEKFGLYVLCFWLLNSFKCTILLPFSCCLPPKYVCFNVFITKCKERIVKMHKRVQSCIGTWQSIKNYPTQPTLPNWHELWKQEKCLSLAPPRKFFHKTRWVRLTQLMSIFTSQNVSKFLIKIQLTKSDPKRASGGKCPPPMLIRVNSSMAKFQHVVVH